METRNVISDLKLELTTSSLLNTVSKKKNVDFLRNKPQKEHVLVQCVF